MSNVEAYLTANATFEDAKSELKAMAQALSQVAALLERKPEGVMFANINDGLPMEISLSGSTTSIDAKQWPTPERIQKAILRRYEAKQAVQRSWTAIPTAMQASLIPPRI